MNNSNTNQKFPNKDFTDVLYDIDQVYSDYRNMKHFENEPTEEEKHWWWYYQNLKLNQDAFKVIY